ncbi:NlpC/P60 family protein [Lysobacter korlensis]|uniref:NlpC/P60 family protein n=1 Tax=Lysobacter korlensis TaxID=553636 RepID=A0ABV6RU96_9GAMM
MSSSVSTRTKPLSAIALAVTAALGTTVGAAGPVQAAPDYPTWDEVEAARDNEQQARAKIAEISGLLTSLRTAAEDAGRSAMQAAERYNIALDDLDAATARAERLEKDAKDAAARAKESAQRAGAMIAQLARTGGGDVTVGLLFDESKDGDLLARLGALSKLTEQSATIYEKAIADRNLARSLTGEARAAETERAKLFDDSKQMLADAQSAAIAAEDLVVEQQEASDELYAQLASLKGTTAEIEREFAEGLQSVPTPSLPTLPRPGGGQQNPQPNNPDPTPSNPAPSNPAPSNPGPSNPAPSNPAPSNPAPSNPAPSNPAPSNPAPSNPAPSDPPPSNPAPPPPNAGKVQTAIAFAKAQLGDPYVLGGTGDPGWDCSGLTKYSYNAAGVYIGSHSSTNQYFTMKGQGRLVPLAQMKAGDLLWYTSSGGRDFYHVALYIGGGQMIEAPYPGKTVRIVPVRYGELWSQAGRPTG